jgi:hypothetical protein
LHRAVEIVSGFLAGIDKKQVLEKGELPDFQKAVKGALLKITFTKDTINFIFS